jgi:hypothetical protein
MDQMIGESKSVLDQILAADEGIRRRMFLML